MADTLAISSHGTRIYRALAATPSTFVEIAEMGDVTPPELSRNDFDATTQDKNIDSYVLGVLRRGEMTVQMNFLPANGTQDHLTGILKALITEPPPVDGYKIVFPDAAATTWIMSGQVKGFAPKAPVDGKLSADVKIRFSGRMLIGTAGSMVVVG